MNLSPDEIDSFDIHVSSDLDKKGIWIPVYETSTASGIFEGIVCFNKDNSSSQGLLKVKDWDNVYAKYIDVTMPNPYSAKDQREIYSTAKIIPRNEKALSPLERVAITKIWLHENKIKSMLKKKEIRLELSNNQNNIQPYAVMLQVQDLEGITIKKLLVKTGKLSSQNQELRFTVPFGNEGHTATIFVWESAEEPIPLCKPHTLDLSKNEIE